MCEQIGWPSLCKILCKSLKQQHTEAAPGNRLHLEAARQVPALQHSNLLAHVCSGRVLLVPQILYTKKAGPLLASLLQAHEAGVFKSCLAHALCAFSLLLQINQVLLLLQEVYTKRLGLFARSAPVKMAVYFVVAGQVAAFRALEGFAGSSVIDVMPVHISDIFPASRS
jgi:hypothetical protein